MSEYEIERGQLDALWSSTPGTTSKTTSKRPRRGKRPRKRPRRGKKKPLTARKGSTGAQRVTHIDSRLRVSRGIAKTETEASEEVFRTLRQNRGHPEKPPSTISDGWGGIREAMVQVWGKVPEQAGGESPSRLGESPRAGRPRTPAGEETTARRVEIPASDQGAR
jgi:hypothetical protein